MNDCFFSIEGTSFDINEINEEIMNNISEKEKNGIYDFNDKKTEIDFLDIKNEDQFMKYHINIIQETWAIDINDFDIPAGKGIKGKMFVLLKKIIWKLLKFYTYRLFSQQIEFNSQVRNSITAINTNFSKKFDKIRSELENIKKEINKE